MREQLQADEIVGEIVKAVSNELNGVMVLTSGKCGAATCIAAIVLGA